MHKITKFYSIRTLIFYRMKLSVLIVEGILKFKKFLIPDIPPKNARRLILCHLKMAVFTRSAFVLSGSSYFSLKFHMKQSIIG